jgi:hypothetical protein
MPHADEIDLQHPQELAGGVVIQWQVGSGDAGIIVRCVEPAESRD